MSPTSDEPGEMKREIEEGERSDEQQYADPVSSHDGLPKTHKKGERRDGKV